jgi:hypothetical protein
MVSIRRSRAHADGKRMCSIGLKPMTSIPPLSYHIFLYVFLISLFAYLLLGGSLWRLGKGRRKEQDALDKGDVS